MGKDRSAIIIGAGIGGLATSVFLARQGYNVSIFEKNSAPGGRCGQLIRDGHRFHPGATMLMMPGVYHEVFDLLGIELREGKDILPLENLYTIFFDDCSSLAFSADSEKMRQQLEKIEPGSFVREREYVESGYRIYNLGMSRLVARNFYNLFQMVNLKNIPLLFQLKAFTLHYKYAGRFFRNERLRMAYTFQNIYVGQNPFKSPALFSMIPAAELTEGSFFPASGGMFNIVEQLLAEAGKQGVKVLLNNPARHDPAAAPPGQETISVEVGTGHIDNHKASNKKIAPDERKTFLTDVNKWLEMIVISDDCNPEKEALIKTLERFRIPLWTLESFARSMIYDINHDGFPSLSAFIDFSQGASVAPASIFVHLCGLNYFADDFVRKNGLSRQNLNDIAHGSQVTAGFRNLIRKYRGIADKYRRETIEIMKRIGPLMEPSYRVSLEIIFSLYLMAFERIDPENGSFTSAELNPSTAETKDRVLETIMNFSI